MRAILRLTVFLLALAGAGGAACADELSALARIDAASSSVRDLGQGVAIDLAVSQAVPYRVSFLDSPPRLIVDFREVDFAGADPARLDRSERVVALNWGPFLAGWSRLVAVLDGPQRLASAEEVALDDGRSVVRLRLSPVRAGDFAAAVAASAAASDPSDWSLPKPAAVEAPIRRQTGAAPLKVVLDPGHGGIDPGAEAGKETEAGIMLSFALELAEALRRAGMTVELTRTTDVFVPLETRISVARAAQADVFLSLHADALPEGEATGATVYKLAAKASDAASAQLAERHDRADLLAGVDLGGNDDEVASVLMDLARRDTQPRADRLARALADRIAAEGLKMHRRPIQEAAFSVLKSADIPSLLLELGFLSSDKDRDRLDDPAWRAAMQQAILSAFQAWAIADAAEAKLLRQ